MSDARPRRLFDGMQFFVTQCAMKTLQRIDDNQPHQPAHSDLILNMLMNVGGMVIVNRVNAKRSLGRVGHFAVRGEEFSLLRDATHVVCDSTHALHPAAAIMLRAGPPAASLGKVVAFAGLGKAPATFEQYMKESVLVLGCSWSGEMHKGVHVLINCLPPLKEHDKITWTYHQALNIPVVTAKWLDACLSQWRWVPTDPFTVTWKPDAPSSPPISFPIVLRACGLHPSTKTFSPCNCSSCVFDLDGEGNMQGRWSLPATMELQCTRQGQPWSSEFTFLVLCGVTLEDLISHSNPIHPIESRSAQLDEEDNSARRLVRTQVLCALAAAKSIIKSSWLDACSRYQRVTSFQPHEAPVVPSLPPKWHRHMMRPLFSRCSVLPLSCTGHALQLLVAGGASIQSHVPSPSKHSYPIGTIVVISRERYHSYCADSPAVLLLASLGYVVVFSTFFEDWALFAAPPPRSKHELPEATAAAASAAAAEGTTASAQSAASARSAPLVMDDHASGSVFRHTDKKNAKCSICRGAAVQGSTGMHIVDITDTSTSGHLACFQWLCGAASPSLSTVQAAVNDCMKHAASIVCSHCKKSCAVVKCAHINQASGEHCAARYHLTCAMSDRALLHQEWFLLLCPRHRPDSVIKLSRGSECVTCHHGPTAELLSRLEDGDQTVGKLKICEAMQNWKIGNRAGDLFNAIRRHQSVHWFDLQGCNLGNDWVRKGLETLQTVKSLETLDLQDNGIDRACLTAIGNFLTFSNVKNLYLQGNPLYTPDFDELEKIVSKLGRECTVYCYKNKDQPTRKLICTSVQQSCGVDESLSFSSAQLNNIFQKYRDRDAVIETAAAADEITYSRASNKLSNCPEDPPLVAGDNVPANDADATVVGITAQEDAAVIVDEPGEDPHHGCSPVILSPDSVPGPSLQSPDQSHLHVQPSVSASLVPAPVASVTSHIDTVVAMGFQREAVELAYAKSGQDLQRTVELLISHASGSSSAPSTAHLNTKNTQKDHVADVRDRSAAVLPVPTVPRHRRIQDSDDDSDDVPALRGAGAAALPAPQTKLVQALVPRDDDEIILLTQSMHHGALNSSAASWPAVASDAPSHDRIPVIKSAPIAASPRHRRIQDSDDDDDDDDVPVFRAAIAAAPPSRQIIAVSAELHHPAQESASSGALSLAAARDTGNIGAAVARPKLKGLGSLVRSEVNAALLQRLRDSDSTLTNLKITKAIFKPAVADDFFSALAVHQHLERLDLDCVSLGMALAARLCREVLPRMPKLKILDLKMNGLGDDICDILMESIFRTRLAQVYLAGNGITKAGASNLKFLLTHWRQHEDTPLSRLQTPLDIFLDSKHGVVSLESVGAPAAQATAAPSSPPLRR